jgi:hypothetical protein
MDKLAYANDIETRLRQLASRLDQFIDRPMPAQGTAEASRQMADTKSRARAAKSRIGETLAAVDQLRNKPDSEWEQARDELEQRWQELNGEFPV